MGKNLIRLLCVVLVVVLLSIGIPLIASPDRQSYECSQEQVLDEIVLIADANGSLVTVWDNEIEDLGASGHNVTLPLFEHDRMIDLNASVSEVTIQYMYDCEVTPHHAAAVTVFRGADLVIDAGNVSITRHSPRRELHVGASLSGGRALDATLTLNSTVLELLNVSRLQVEYEVTFLTQCTSSYLVNYAMSISVQLQYRHPVPNVIRPLFVALLAVGICSIGVLVIEVEYPLKTEQQPSP